MNPKRYAGKICDSHPELSGERLKSNSRCIACHNSRRHQLSKDKYHSDPRYKERYLKQRSVLKKKWNRFAQYTAAYRAALAQRTPPWVDKDKIAAVYREAEKLGLTVDHIIPLRGRTVSGLHVHNNLRPLSQSENDRKSNKFIEELL